MSVESAPPRLTDWLQLINGIRSRANLLESASRSGIDPTAADQLLDQLLDAGLIRAHKSRLRIAIHPGGLIGEQLGEALRNAGVEVDATAGIVVFPQGQVPCLFGAPQGVRRLIPVWFEADTVHVGPVLDAARGPCPECIDRTWAQLDRDWTALVAQSTTVATWHERTQLLLAAGAIAHLADSPLTVGLEMIFDPLRPGPMWRVWTVNADCVCQLPQVREQPHLPVADAVTRGHTTTGPGSSEARR